jgi:hypothetical protein
MSGLDLPSNKSDADAAASWIDQRINDGVAVLWLLLWCGFSFFFWQWRIGAMSDRGHLGQGEHPRNSGAINYCVVR